ncbi:transcriptional regulator [Catenulispora sp. GP43]|uniref:FMN-binding negative transcriptional regulator n=1 Tax=Catenulispora sp. GP43 TaxID=3156263 RepID=UPI0035178018
MYVPALYEPATDQQIGAVLRGHPLALLLTNGLDVPHATNLPMVFRDDEPGDVVGSTLWGHMNRANPHWRDLADGMSAKAVFSGPGTYISPVNYQIEPAAPTWDFVTVHLRGTLRVVQAGEETLAVVRRTADLLEASFGDGWDPSGSVGYFRSIVRGVGAFEFRVEAAEAMFKLSQEKSPEIQQRLIDRFATQEARIPACGVATLMREMGLGERL